jgi:hypothetical protein
MTDHEGTLILGALTRRLGWRCSCGVRAGPFESEAQAWRSHEWHVTHPTGPSIPIVDNSA